MPASSACSGGYPQPRIRVEPARAFSNADVAQRLMAAYAHPLDAWQLDILECWLGRDADGKLTAMSCGLSCPRQNGKNYILQALELTLLMSAPDTHILHTAHQVRTARRSFEHLARIFENPKHPELRSKVDSVRRTNGEERIVLANGNTIEYASRSRSSARGFDAISLVVFDECQELTDEQLEALMATLAASPTGDRQTVYMGTPPSPGCPGKVFYKRRAAAIAEPTPRTAWHEWSVESMPAGDARFEQVVDDVLATNPAMGSRLSIEFAEEEFCSMTADGFARERLGWWSSVEQDAMGPVISPEEWDALAVDGPAPEGRTAFGVKFSVDGEEVALAAAVMGESGVHVELVARESMARGFSWLVPWIKERKSTAVCVVIDGKSHARALVESLGRMPVNYVVMSGSEEVTAASAAFLECVRSGRLTWYSKQENLRASVTTSPRRTVGSRGGWSFGGADSTPVEAAALAVWGVQNSKRVPGRVQRIG